MTAASRCILLINHEYPPLSGAGGQATYYIAQEMAALGHHPIVLTAAWKGLPRISNEDGVTVHRIPGFRRRAEHYTVFEMAAFAISALIFAPGIVRQWRPDTAIVFFGLPNGPVGWYLKWRFKLPYVIALQGGDVPGFTTTYADWHQSLGGLLKRLWADADAVIANSGSLATFAKRSAPDQAIAVIPAGADVTGITPKTIYSTRGGLRLLFVGRLVRERGLDVLVQALAKLPFDLGWRLVLAGDGPEWTNLAGLAARLNIAERVQVRGWVKHEELPALYQDADVFVLPSRIDGTPSALLEAMAAGLPVIGTRVPTTVEAVDEGKTGFLVDVGDVDGLAKAILTLANDTGLRGAMGQAGRTRAELRFGWPAIANLWLETTAKIARP